MEKYGAFPTCFFAQWFLEYQRAQINEVLRRALKPKNRNTLATLNLLFLKRNKKYSRNNKRDRKKWMSWYRLTLSKTFNSNYCCLCASNILVSEGPKSLANEFAYIIEEFIILKILSFPNKEDYYSKIIQSILSFRSKQPQFYHGLFLNLIQRLVVDALHVCRGIIYDRGPYPDKIVDTIKWIHHSVDIQMG